ncbi:MAG: hypothetical protein LUG60_00210 [Erysipelotrichaceae bacterium]|nr:hypothetical protein [Erysipelotrichaceae bacterium]
MSHIPKDELRDNLIDAGCDEEYICQILECDKNDDYQRQTLLLKKQRYELLDKLHDRQKQIDCLDYLLYELKKEQL